MSTEDLGRPFWRLYWLDASRQFKQQAYTDQSLANQELEAKSRLPGMECAWLEECRVVRRVNREGGR